MRDHPNIAKVLDAGATVPGHGVPPSGGPDRLKPGLHAIPADRAYFVMELVRGIPLTQYKRPVEVRDFAAVQTLSNKLERLALGRLRLEQRGDALIERG